MDLAGGLDAVYGKERRPDRNPVGGRLGGVNGALFLVGDV